jgi:hypothetical protein
MKIDTKAIKLVRAKRRPPEDCLAIPGSWKPLKMQGPWASKVQKKYGTYKSRRDLIAS